MTCWILENICEFQKVVEGQHVLENVCCIHGILIIFSPMKTKTHFTQVLNKETDNSKVWINEHITLEPFLFIF